jgi:hypothetical protein
MRRRGLRWPVGLALHTMPRRLPQPSDDVTVYLVLNDHGQFGNAYDETDPAKADR